MFNRRRSNALYYAIGIGAGVLALAGAGTFFLVRRRNVNVRDMTAQAKRVIQKTTHHPSASTPTTHHAKRSRANGHSRGHNARA